MVRHRGDAKTRTERAPYTTDWIGEKAAAFVDGFEARDDQPWFMQVSPHAPHQEQTAPGPDSCNLEKMYTWPARYDAQPIPPWKPTPAEQIEGGPNGKAEKQDKVPFVRGANFTHKCGQVTYDGAMKTLMVADDMVDTIMTRLQTTGELANTLVLLGSDNGYSWNERGMTSKGVAVDASTSSRRCWCGGTACSPPGRPTAGSSAPRTTCRPTSTPPATRHRTSAIPSTAARSCPARPARTEKYLELGPVLPPDAEGVPGPPGDPGVGLAADEAVAVRRVLREGRQHRDPVEGVLRPHLRPLGAEQPAGRQGPVERSRRGGAVGPAPEGGALRRYDGRQSLPLSGFFLGWGHER